MDTGKPINIAVVDDHAIMRQGLIKQVLVDRQFNVVSEAGNGKELLDKLAIAEVLPDIAIVDIRMPVMDGFALSDELKSKYPQIRILILSAYTSEYNIAVMINKGVRGYLLKDSSPLELRKALRDIYETGYYFSKLANEQAFKMLQNVASNTSIGGQEKEFLQWSCTELRYDQIAQKMGISMQTLEDYRESLFSRLGIGSRVALALFALKSGIIDIAFDKANLTRKF